MSITQARYPLLLALVSVATSANAISAQRTPARIFQQDSARVAGERAGRLAAEAVETTFVAPAGFLVGLPVGFFGTLALGGKLPQVSGTALLVAAGVGAVVVTVLKRSDAPSRMVKPTPVAAQLPPDIPPDSLFKLSSRRAYEHRLVERREKSLLTGGAIGVGVGAFILWRLLAGYT